MTFEILQESGFLAPWKYSTLVEFGLQDSPKHGKGRTPQKELNFVIQLKNKADWVLLSLNLFKLNIFTQVLLLIIGDKSFPDLHPLLYENPVQ